VPVTGSTSTLPFYFGPADKQLFGCYHEPRAGQKRDRAVVICQPMGHEYIYCHRALRQLAVRLCDSGFSVLRFDFHGCGDSSGEAEDGRVVQWLQDISIAIAETRIRASATQICLMGLRLGAALAFIVASQQADIDSVIMWDPVIVGKTYVEGLDCLQRDALRCRCKSIRRTSNASTEIIGFPLHSALRTELKAIDLLAIVPNPTTKVLAIQSHRSENEADLKDYLTSRVTRFDHQELDAPTIWQPTVDGNLLVPIQILRSIVDWASRMQA
jgi:uncharacterized protein